MKTSSTGLAALAIIAAFSTACGPTVASPPTPEGSDLSASQQEHTGVPSAPAATGTTSDPCSDPDAGPSTDGGGDGTFPFPALDETYGIDVESWWSGSPFNPASPGYIPVGKITDPQPVLDVRDAFGGNIQAAIDALPQSGGTLFFKPGTYVNNIQLAGRSHVHFVSDGDAIIQNDPNIAPYVAGCVEAVDNYTFNPPVVQGDASDPAVQADLRCVTSGRIGDIYFRNLVFDGAGTDQESVAIVAANGVVFDHCTFQNHAPHDGYGPEYNEVEATSVVDNIWFRGCHFVGPSRWGVRMDGAHHSGIVESTFDSNYGWGYVVLMTYTDITGDYNRDGTLQPNELRQGNYIALVDNVFGTDGPLDSMYLGVGGHASHVLIQGNTFNRHVDYLLNLGGECQMGDPSVYPNGQVHYDFLGSKIIGNNVTNTVATFVTLDGQGYNCDPSKPGFTLSIGQFTVEGNSLSQTADKLPSFVTFEGTVLDPNIIQNNCLGGQLYGTGGACP